MLYGFGNYHLCIWWQKNKSDHENRKFFMVFFVVSHFIDFVIENHFLPVYSGWEIG